ncbi:MAG TPA: amidohydrolase family protein [Candidatus Latescibacteria bacterium]|jgi:predicted TIM-barrel fold metal-dependent hydrolase|nr:amidohydrolase family protein [Candidatus Latescibacterota bacterium]HJP31054.1 amidohydrolase family protein [Candidatus Latescibacterota bacterium]
MEKVDVHVHVFDRLRPEFPRGVSALAPADREATAEQLLAEMGEADIDKAVLIDMGGTDIEQHNYVAHCVRTWPDRFTATGLVDVADPAAADRLTELYEATPIEGIRLGGGLGDPAAEQAEDLTAYPLFQRAAELGVNINLYGRSDGVASMELLVAAFPGINISLDHLGICPSTPLVPDAWVRPRFEQEPLPPATYEQILGLARYDNVHVKVSGEYAFSKAAYPYADMKPMVERVYETFGPERMMWCTDFPWIVAEPGYGRLAQMIDHHLPGIPTREREMMMGGNALGIWFRR